MAGRIRSIKPEILEDERSAGLSSDAWRLWVSMWLLADDHGRLRGAAQWLHSQVFWSCPHPVSVPDLLIELDAAGVIVRYEVSGQKYIEIPGWSKHQKIDHKGKPRIPTPCGDSSRESRDSLANPLETVVKVSETLAPDLRSPISDQRPATSEKELSADADASQGTLFAVPAPAEPEKPAKPKPPPLPFTPDEAMKMLAVASRGRFVASTLNKGQSITVTGIIRKHPTPDTWMKVGAWIGNGGDGWAREGLDIRNIGSFDVWLAKADAKPPPVVVGRGSPLPLSSSVTDETRKARKF